ncbi:MAG: DUF6569 family protein [Pyrinomonadaceae bacterium]
MKQIRSTAFLLISTLLLTVAVFGQSYKVSDSYSHKNLSIFLIQGKDQRSGDNIVTLEEALENKEFQVFETSDVNELMVQNLSTKNDVFIQSGDIVKGGKQDRVLAVSVIIPRKSGKITIEAFCVESGRWTSRDGESVSTFGSSKERIVSKELKLAANMSKSQTEVWSEVSNAQEKISVNVGGSVVSNKSETSLQLSLEDKKIKETIAEYIDKLGDVTDKKTDVIGYAFAINGQINSADVYVSKALFKKLWPKMLRAAAIEAVAKSDKKGYSTVTRENVIEFLADSAKASSSTQAVTNGSKVVTKKAEEKVVFESMDKSDVVIHRSYVKID